MIIKETVKTLLELLEKNKIEYAILRNYDKLPELKGNDLDIVCYKKDINRICSILIYLSKYKNWDYLLEDCTFTSKSYCRNIFIFKFYRRSPLTALQVDFFGGFPILGVCFLNASVLLKSKIKIDGFYVISEKYQLLIRIFQLWKTKFNFSKDEEREENIKNSILMLYRKLKFSNKSIFNSKFLDKRVELLVDKIDKNEKFWNELFLVILKIRYIYFLQFIFRNFFKKSFWIEIFGRVQEIVKKYYYVFWIQDLIIPYFQEYEAMKILNEMKKNKIIRVFFLKNRFFSFKDLFMTIKVKERGGVVIKLQRTGKKKENLDTHIFSYLLKGNKKILYEKKK